MMDLIFRLMIQDDLPQVFKVRTSTLENAVSMEQLSNYGITVASMTDALSADVQGWVCQNGGSIVGFCMGNKDSAEMQVLAVLPNFEGMGIAKQLMLKIQKCLFDQGHEYIWLLTTFDPKLRAYGFYQHMQWVATGELIKGEEKFILYKQQFEK